MNESEKKKLTLSVDSKIVKKAMKDPNINISDMTETFLRAFTSSSETSDKEELYKNYQELFNLMSRLLRKFRVKTRIGEEVVEKELEDDEDITDLEPIYDDVGQVVGYESGLPPDIFHFYLEPDGSLSHDIMGDIKDIKEIPIESFYRPQEIIDTFLEAIQEGVEYRKDQFREIEMAKTIIDALTKTTLSKSKRRKKK